MDGEGLMEGGIPRKGGDSTEGEASTGMTIIPKMG
jgi:hypothetical protein